MWSGCLSWYRAAVPETQARVISVCRCQGCCPSSGFRAVGPEKFQREILVSHTFLRRGNGAESKDFVWSNLGVLQGNLLP